MNPLSWFTSLLKSLLSFLLPNPQKIYGLDHAVLNLPVPPPSMWMNMGYWKNESDLPGACRALLDQVLITAGLLDPAGGPVSLPSETRLNLIDVGVGCGDQSLRLVGLKRLSLGSDGQEKESQLEPLFDSYIGLTLLPGQAEFARERLVASSSTSASKSTSTQANIFCANAANPPSWPTDLKSLTSSPPPSNPKTKTWLLALDTLYHFQPSRKPLLQHTHTPLHASFIAFDLLLSPTAGVWEKLLLRIFCILSGTPFENFITQAEYEALLVGAGYSLEGIRVRDVSGDVFAGIAGFIGRKDEMLKRVGLSVGGKFRGAGWFFGWWARSGVVRGCVVVAER